MKYKLEKEKITKDGHTMFDQDIVKDLNRLDYLEKNKNQEREYFKESFMVMFLDWFGSWQMDKNLDDYGIEDVVHAFKSRNLSLNE